MEFRPNFLVMWFFNHLHCYYCQLLLLLLLLLQIFVYWENFLELCLVTNVKIFAAMYCDCSLFPINCSGEWTMDISPYGL